MFLFEYPRNTSMAISSAAFLARATSAPTLRLSLKPLAPFLRLYTYEQDLLDQEKHKLEPHLDIQ